MDQLDQPWIWFNGPMAGSNVPDQTSVVLWDIFTLCIFPWPSSDFSPLQISSPSRHHVKSIHVKTISVRGRHLQQPFGALLVERSPQPIWDGHVVYLSEVLCGMRCHSNQLMMMMMMMMESNKLGKLEKLKHAASAPTAHTYCSNDVCLKTCTPLSNKTMIGSNWLILTVLTT